MSGFLLRRAREARQPGRAPRQQRRSPFFTLVLAASQAVVALIQKTHFNFLFVIIGIGVADGTSAK